MTEIYSVEGNIGSGKSTLIKNLKDVLGVGTSKTIIYLPEPVSVWESIKQDNENIIEKFYKDQKTYAFSFQMMAYISRISQLRKAIKSNPNSIIITERSVYTDKNVFAKMLHDENKIKEINYQIYLQWFDEFVNELPIKGIIYVKTTPTKCHTRVLKRNRKGETIPIEYLTNCHDYHENWLANSNQRILYLEGDKDYNKIPNDWVKCIRLFIKEKSYKDTKNQDDYIYTMCTC